MSEALPGLPGGEHFARERPCPDCGATFRGHVRGCWTSAVERGLVTPRERQIRLHEERARRVESWNQARSVVVGNWRKLTP